MERKEYIKPRLTDWGCISEVTQKNDQNGTIPK